MTISMVVEVDMDDVEKLLDSVENATGVPSLMDFMNTRLNPWMINETVQRFANEGDWRSGNWPELSDATVRIREQQGYDGEWPINVRTEDLFVWLAEGMDIAPDADGVEASYPGSERDGILMEKLLTAQRGRAPGTNPMMPDGGKGTPPRPVLAFDEVTDTQTILELLANHMARRIVGGIL